MINKKLKISQNPYQLYAAVFSRYEESFLLESHDMPDRLSRFSFIGFDPESKISAKGNVVNIDGQEEDSNQPIRMIAKCVPKINYGTLGFNGGAVGYFSYDYVRILEKIPDNTKDSLDFPDFEFGIYKDAIIYDHYNKCVSYISHEKDRSNEIESLAKEEMHLEPFSCQKPKSNIGKEEFIKNVMKAKKKLEEGEIFQVVLSRRYETEYDGCLLGFYNYLKHTNPSPYMFFLSFKDRKIVGSSPENLVRVEGNKIESFATLAGTMVRGKTKSEDIELEKKLMNDEKEKAEHMMLVDLTRNDISKVAKIGSVKVPELMKVQKFRHVQHLSSQVVGLLAENKDCFDAFDAIFPAGTVSGAPKIRAMQIIEEIEKEKRGPYAGAVGYFSFNQNCDFAISIRTLFSQGKKAFISGGAGIVYDSVPIREYEETENKMRSLLCALEEKEI